MTTCLEIGTRALRAMGAISAGKVPAGNDAADILQHLQDTINDIPLLRDGEWSEVILTSAETYEAADGERVHTSGYAATITLPTTVTDDCGNETTPDDLSRVQIIGGDQAGLWIYSASNAAWAQVDALEISDESPFGRDDDAGLVALVAVNAMGEYGAEVSPVVIARAQRQIASFRARFYREVIVGVDRAFLIGADMGSRYYYARGDS